MKKSLSTVLLCSLGIFATVSISAAQTYTIIQLTDNDYEDTNYHINASGEVVWVQRGKIFHYNGSTITQITHDSFKDGGPDINNNGLVAWGRWDGNDSEVFYYDGSTITQITDNPYHDSPPRINDNGDMVWYGFDGEDYEIFFYHGSIKTIAQLTNNSYDDRGPLINERGDVAWEVTEIYLYDGSAITRITDNSWDEYGIDLNDNGQMVWYAEPDGTDREMFFYDGVTVTQLTDNSVDDDGPNINLDGYVVWHREGEIILYDGKEITQITDDSDTGWNRSPDINADGDIVWRKYDGEDGEIHLYNRSTKEITQLTDNSFDDRNPHISDNGEIVWEGGWPEDSEIFLAILGSPPEPAIQIISPNGGEELFGGTSHEIFWGSYGDIENVRIEYSVDGGTNWEIIATSTENDGFYLWEIPFVLSSTCIVKISDIDGDPSDIGDGVFSIIGVSCAIFKPNGGEVIPSGSNYTVQWVALPDAVTFKLKYSINNGKKWKLIAEDVIGNEYEWKVPTPLRNKRKCLVKVIGYDALGRKVGADESDAPFTIQVLRIVSPNGGETLPSNTKHLIWWTTNETKGYVAEVRLLYTKNRGKKWNLLVSLPWNLDSYDWTVPDLPRRKRKCKVKVVLKDVKGNTVGSDTSDGYFTIQP